MIDDSRRTLASLFAVCLLLSSAVAPVAAEPWISEDDADHCVPDHQQIATGAFGLYSYTTGCYDYLSGGTINTTETDAAQAKVDIYAAAQNGGTNSDLLLNAHSNHLQDTETTALMIGKNAYIRSMNNGSSQAAAETAAKQAVAGYYATKQIEILQAWDAALAHYQYLHDTARNESGISAASNFPSWGTKFVGVDNAMNEEGTDYRGAAHYNGLDTQSLSLVNGTTEDVTGYSLRAFKFYPGADPTPTGTNTWTPADGDPHDFSYSGITHTSTGQLIIQPPNDNYDEQVYLDPQRFHNVWTETQSQNAAVQSQMETLVNQTYSEYQAGMINNSDLVDPYLMQREYAPNGSFQAWATSTLTTIGVNSPEALDSMGHFNVTTPNASYEGMLMSETNPASGSFAINGTYNAANITGQQYVVTASNMVELTGEFTITDIRDTSGQQVQNVTIEERNYSTVNMTEYRNLLESLREERAEIEAREQNIRNDGGGFVIGENSSLGLIVLGAGGLLLLFGRGRGGNGGNGGFP